MDANLKKKSTAKSADEMIERIFDNSQSFKPKKNSCRISESCYSSTKTVSLHSQNIPHTACELPSPVNFYSNIKSKEQVKLPPWLLNLDETPEIFTKAVDLVQNDNQYIDTNRAFLLLINTNINPQVLGILWESVHRSAADTLEVNEFKALLVLIALVQMGNPCPSVDNIQKINDPVYPFINHPSLVALNPSKSNIAITDEFNDFVSASFEPSSMSCSDSKKFKVSENFAKSFESSKDDLKNLPVLGVSPNLSPQIKCLKNTSEQLLGTAFINKDNTEDEFCDFISAVEPPATIYNLSQTFSMTKKLQNKETTISLKKDDDGTPKNDVLTPVNLSLLERSTSGTTQTDIEESSKDPDNNVFIKLNNSNPAAINLEYLSVDSEDKYAVFRDLPESVGTNACDNFSSVAEDEFSDFVSSEPVGFSSSLFPPADALISSETQSIASLELPEFDSSLSVASTELLPSSLLASQLQNSLMPEIESDANECTTKLESSKFENLIVLKCFKSCRDILIEAKSVIDNLVNDEVADEILSSSQMHDYLDNLSSVHEVIRQITVASYERNFSDKEFSSISRICEEIWMEIVENLSKKWKFTVQEIEDNDGEKCCICLNSSDQTIRHGKYLYHLSCANLWLNKVDVTLPMHSEHSF